MPVMPGGPLAATAWWRYHHVEAVALAMSSACPDPGLTSRVAAAGRASVQLEPSALKP